jgi:uncharacterized protein (DUF427 family)
MSAIGESTCSNTIMSSTAPPFAQPRIESSVKRVRVLFGGKYVVDTTQAKLV